MDIRQLRYFCAIAEEGQISRAAQRLHIAQPPLSYQLKLLEEELGVKLVDRNTRSLSLTQAGRVFYQRAEQILGMLQAAASEVKDVEYGVNGILAIGSPPAIGNMYIPERIARFHEEYPYVRFQWREGNTFRVLELLESDMIEFGIVRLPVPAGAYEQLPLLTESWLAVARQDDARWQGKNALTLEELGAVPLILMHRQAGIYCHDMVVDEMKNKGISPDIVCESDNISAILAVVDKGIGMAILPESTLSVRPAEDFHRMAISGCQLESSSAIIWKKEKRLSRAAKLFLELF